MFAVIKGDHMLDYQPCLGQSSLAACQFRRLLKVVPVVVQCRYWNAAIGAMHRQPGAISVILQQVLFLCMPPWRFLLYSSSIGKAVSCHVAVVSWDP